MAVAAILCNKYIKGDEHAPRSTDTTHTKIFIR